MPTQPQLARSLENALNSALHGTGSAVDRPHQHTTPALPRRNYSTGQATAAKPATNGERTMAAKYPGTCRACKGAIAEGDTIVWAKGQGGRHADPADCSGNAQEADLAAAQAPPAPARTERMATSGQLNLVATLQVERGVPNVAPEALTFAEASALISTLIAMPKISAGKRRIDLGGVPEGRYAVLADEGHLAFYNVTVRGVFVQASDTLHALPSAAAEQGVLAKIAVDPAEAARTYGREIGDCGVCGRTLTNDVSRKHGIGPICRSKTGW